MSKVAFVRTEMLPPQPPPPNMVGPIGWLRDNLFDGWWNTALTIVSALFVFMVFNIVLPWAIAPTWYADSLNECREILKELGREGQYSGACWGVIRDRWIQLLFGFYPSEFYWRPILAFALLAVALAPILFADHVPRKLIRFSAVYPFVMPWLLWGGSFWTPLLAVAGFAVGWAVHRAVSASAGALVALLAGVLAALIWWLFLIGPISEVLQSIVPMAIEVVKSRNFGGFMLSLTIGITAIAVSLPLGIMLALGRQSDLMIVKSLCVGFIEFIRGVPLITLLFVASTLLNIFLPPGTDFDIILRVIIMTTLFSSAYIAVYRAVQGYDAGVDHRPARSAGAQQRHPR